ncbi:MAG: conjugal transfer protein TraN [Deltaproteobacteria bacterium]|nr:conjugal transfer protein TraN [Deltaproteobacteria bacterium]
MGLPYACWVPGSSDQCPGNNPPSGATVRGCWERKIPEEGGGCTARFYEFHSWHDQIVTYICSLTGTSYSSSSACQSNCSQSVACTSTCPSEYTKSGSLCIANASCSSGGTLNTSVGKCQYAPTYNCDSGYTYDSAIGYCKANATCNSSGTLNTSDDKCQLSYSYSCPSDYTYNYTYSVCQKTPVCSSGTYNTSTDRCEQDASAVCTTGYTYDGATGMCKVNVICGDGGSLNTSTDKCEITYTPTCASGFAYNAAYDVCQIVPSCPTGGSYNTSHDQCEVDNSWNCPSGMSLTGSTCYEAVTCPSGGNLNGDTELCEADSTFACFTSGYSYDGSANRCISDPVCDYGYYDVSIDLCRLSASGICPETYTYNSYQNKCLLDPPCLVGAAYSTTLNQCSISAVYDCPDTSEYSAVTRLCWAYPMCPGDMPYNEEINGCDGGYRTCPLGAYPCLPEPGTGIKKCSPNECFDPIAAIVGTDEEADTTSYHNDGDRDPETGECEGIVYIFNGKGGTCKTPGMQTMFFNCCDTSEGSFLMVKKTCGEAEAMTMQAVQAGRCHYVGDYCAKKWKFIGCVQRAKTYCCFNSKLGRIIQEQGREQLQNFQPGGNWGSAESPNCVGFTPEQFAMIDFSRIDLSEFVGDIQGQIKTNIEEGMENKIDDFYDNY